MEASSPTISEMSSDWEKTPPDKFFGFLEETHQIEGVLCNRNYPAVLANPLVTSSS
ncbi:hypothetical protein [Pseudomonas marginalis]|uniref:hypothetical protein n=1 Tax=Pseudomonas marginalis TaxID=298 RepID=UPI002A358CF2|nr:hypothetical protein [Pseudomonas marginalis]WPN25484.1 hypothetical protein QMK57_09045 [Pseudomonas marginalis]